MKTKKEILEMTQTVESKIAPLTRIEANYLNNELPKHIRQKRKLEGTLLKAGDIPNPVAEQLLISRGIRKKPLITSEPPTEKPPTEKQPTYTERDLLTGQVVRKGIITPQGIKEISKTVIPPASQTAGEKQPWEMTMKKSFVQSV